MSLRNILKGTGVAVVTPFNEDESIDYQSLDKTIDFLLDDELLEVTPKNLRLRKRLLDPNDRKRLRNQSK